MLGLKDLAAMKSILVAVDTSARAPAVLAQAVLLASATGAQVHLYRSVGLPVELPMNLYSAPVDLMAALIDAAERGLAHLTLQVPEPLRGQAIAEVATAWDGICRRAITLDVDLIVLGSHGYSGLDYLLGTTAARVVNHADRSVMVVREKPKAPAVPLAEQA